jgi:hypothetical protein
MDYSHERAARIAIRMAEDDKRQEWLRDLNERYTTDEKGLMMARPKKVKDAETNPAADIIAALAFIKSAVGEEAAFAHVRFDSGRVMATDGKMSAGCLIPGNDLDCCPQYEGLAAALKRATGSVAFTVNGGTLTIASGRLTVRVPCLDVADMTPVAPQGARIAVGERLRKAFAIAGTLASEASDDYIEASLLLEAGTCSGTDRKLCVQYYHGINMPRMVVPKRFTQAIVRTPKEITGLGFEWSDEHNCPSSVTIWFKDNSWIKSICYFNPWPVEQINKIFNTPLQFEDTPDGFFEGVEALAEFTKSNRLAFNDNYLATEYVTEQGSHFEVKGLKGLHAFNVEYLKEIKPWTTKIDYQSVPHMLYFLGDFETEYEGEGDKKHISAVYPRIRGVLCGMARTDAPIKQMPPNMPAVTFKAETNLDDEIPY